jgi:hypothetical protein
VGFVVDKVALGQVFPEYFSLPPSISFHRCSMTGERMMIIIIIIIIFIVRLRCVCSVCCGVLLHKN